MIDYSLFKIAKPAPRAVDRIERKRELAKQERETRKAVRERDRCVCRVCRKPAAHQHHLQMRSRGGKWTESNVVQLCHSCHTAVHQHVLDLIGDGHRLVWEWRHLDPPKGVAKRGVSTR